MTPTHFIDRSHLEPTLGLLVQQAISAGADRACLVKRAGPGGVATLFIVLIGDQAVLDVGPFLKAHCARLPQPVTALAASSRLLMNPGVPLRHALNWMNDHQFLHALQHIEVGGHDGLFYIITGPSVTADLAAQLTTLGLPCNLT